VSSSLALDDPGSSWFLRVIDITSLGGVWETSTLDE
jgi:hypothetical protein